MIFSERLKMIRNSKGFTQAAVASEIQITHRQHQNCEAGDSAPLSVPIRLADFFDVSLDYLAGRSDSPDMR